MIRNRIKLLLEWRLTSIGMLMKSHEFAGAYFAIMFLLIAACSANNSATMATFQNASVTKVVDEKTARTFDCRNANEYRFVVVENPNRKKDFDPAIPRDLNILVGDEVISKIELPKEGEVKNFSLHAIKKNRFGFEVRVDWGGGLNHYYIQFNFRCKENTFYLYRVKKISFLTRKPDRGFWDTKKIKVTRPNLPIEKFVMTSFL